MISLDNVSVFAGEGERRSILLDSICATIPTNGFYVILGQARSGKSSLARVLSGVVAPDEGRVVRSAKISFPVGFTGGFERQLTVRQNILLACRIYDADFDEVRDFVARVMGGEDELDVAWSDLPVVQRTKFGHAIGYGLPFDTYVVDGRIEVGDEEFRRFCFNTFESRAAHAGIILLTQNPQLVRRYGRCSAILHSGQLWPVDDAARALEVFRSLPVVPGDEGA